MVELAMQRQRGRRNGARPDQPRRWCRTLVGSGGLVLMLAACAGPYSQVQRSEIAMAYTRPEVAYGIDGRDVATQVVGNPFGGDKAAFDRAVTEQLTRSSWLPAHFTTSPGPSARPMYHVVLVFNSSYQGTAASVCGPEGAAPAVIAAPAAPVPPQGEISLLAAFCRNGGALTAAFGSVSGVDSADAPWFRTLIADTNRELFPLSNPDSGSLF